MICNEEQQDTSMVSFSSNRGSLKLWRREDFGGFWWVSWRSLISFSLYNILLNKQKVTMNTSLPFFSPKLPPIHYPEIYIRGLLRFVKHEGLLNLGNCWPTLHTEVLNSSNQTYVPTSCSIQNCMVNDAINQYTSYNYFNLPLAVPWFRAFPKESIVCIILFSLTEFFIWQQSSQNIKNVISQGKRNENGDNF